MVLINHKSYSDPVISHSVALVLVMHFAQCGAVCVTTYWCVSRDASGMQKKKKHRGFVLIQHLWNQELSEVYIQCFL